MIVVCMICHMCCVNDVCVCVMCVANCVECVVVCNDLNECMCVVIMIVLIVGQCLVDYHMV